MAESFIQLPADGAGKKLRTIEETVGANSVHSQVVDFRRLATFQATPFDVALTVSKLLVLLNRNTAKVIRIWRVNVYISSEAAVTGVLAKMKLSRYTATATLSGGTAVTPSQMDTSDVLPTSIDAMSKPTSTVTEASRLKTFLLSTDEAVVSTLDADAFSSQMFPRDSYALYNAPSPPAKPITLRTNGTTHEGVGIENLVGAAGNIGMEILFTVSDE